MAQTTDFFDPQAALARRLWGAPVQVSPLSSAGPVQGPVEVAPTPLDPSELSGAENSTIFGDRLAASAGSGPVRTPVEALGRVAKTLAGAYIGKKGEEKKAAYAKKKGDYIAKAFGGDPAKLGGFLLGSDDPDLQKLGLSYEVAKAQRDAERAGKANEPLTVAQKQAHEDRVAASATAASQFEKTQTAAEKRAADERSLRRDLANQSNASRIEAAKLRATSTQSGLTKQAIDDGASYFIQTGTMPVGLRNRADQTAIQNRIAEMKPAGIDTATWMKGLTNAGMSFNARKQAAATTGKQQALTVVNENTVNGSIKILDDLLKQGAASDLKFVSANDALQWMRRQTNDPLANNLKNAVGAISNEYARVMTGQTGGAASSDSARNEASTRMLLGFKEGTMRSVAAQLQKEMKTRSDSYLSVMNQLTGGEYSGPAINAPVDINPAAPAPAADDHDALLKKYGL